MDIDRVSRHDATQRHDFLVQRIRDHATVDDDLIVDQPRSSIKVHQPGIRMFEPDHLVVRPTQVSMSSGPLSARSP